MTKDQREFLTKVYKENNLNADDIFTLKKKNRDGTIKEIPIICRTGIEKIAATQGIKIVFKAEKIEKDFACIKAIGQIKEDIIETYGSAFEGNSKTNYFAEMAEKRAFARVVLKLVKLYQIGVFGEDEADEFKKI